MVKKFAMTGGSDPAAWGKGVFNALRKEQASEPNDQLSAPMFGAESPGAELRCKRRNGKLSLFVSCFLTVRRDRKKTDKCLFRGDRGLENCP